MEDRAGLELPEEAHEQGPTRLGALGAEHRVQVGSRAGRTQAAHDFEAFAIELEQVARVAMEGQSAPRLATQADRRLAPEPGEDPRRAAHTRSSSLTMAWAARDSLGSPLLAFAPLDW